MVGSNIVGSNNTYESNSIGISIVPRCGCDRAMKMWVANSVQNQNRKFYKCRNTGVSA